MFSTMNIFKDVLPLKRQRHLLLSLQSNHNPHTFPHTFEAAEAQTPHSTLTLLILAGFYMKSFHQNLPETR
jgi:hypothetical protein